MSFQVPTVEPDVLRAGDTWKWKKSLGDYPASSWVLSYYLVQTGTQIDITAGADGDDHLVNVPAATTAPYAAGTYNFEAYVTDGTDRHHVLSGTIAVKTNLATQEDGYDARSHVKKVLDAINAVIENKASADQKFMQLEGNSIGKYTHEEVLILRDKYQALYNQELAVEQKAKGRGTGRNVLVRFKKP